MIALYFIIKFYIKLVFLFSLRCFLQLAEQTKCENLKKKLNISKCVDVYKVFILFWTTQF